MSLPPLVAHRGYARRFPENTLAAVRGALEVGARHVEIDVQLTADETPILFHDRTLERMCGVLGAAHERTDAEISKLRAAERGRFGEVFADEPVATLAGFAELLEGHPEVEAFVELKRAAIERFGVDVVLERTLPALAPIRGRCILISFSIEVLERARALDTLPVGPVLESWKDLTHPAVRALEPACVFANETILPARGPVGLDGPRLCVYEIDDPARALELSARGVDMIETFAIGEMLTAFAEP
jgi:glycerophosphoryl diester phosphodiesterase